MSRRYNIDTRQRLKRVFVCEKYYTSYYYYYILYAIADRAAENSTKHLSYTHTHTHTHTVTVYIT